MQDNPVEVYKNRKKANHYLKSIIIALLLFIFDAFVLNHGIIAIIILVIVSPVMFVQAFTVRKDKYLLRNKLNSAIIYFFIALLILLSNYINNSLAENRANKIIKACEEYRSRIGVYPNQLSNLVPDYLQNIPSAKYVFIFNKFKYSIFENKHSLMYTLFPPFGRKIYKYEEKKWIYLD